eukprot:GILK01000417.1.p1 GENE.GILK01000417.1~~GILK01000417.1.p1  ORF type:complete len:524 (-),score=86.04 GILK01000417.1:429-1952(-)
MADRKKQFKSTFDHQDLSKRRQESTVELRKNIREENLQKKRQTAGGFSGAVAGGAFREAVDTSVQLRLEALPQMVHGVNSQDPMLQYDATQQFRKLLSIERNPPIQAVIDSGVVPRFIEFLTRADSPALQFEAAWALTNIASGSSEDTQVVVQKGAVPIFVQLLSSLNDDVREQAVWALGNIAGDSPACRDLVLQNNSLEPLLKQLQSTKLSMLRNATWTLSNLCRGKPQPPFEWVSPALPTLSNLIYSHDDEVLTDACWALSYLSDGPNDRIQAVIETGVCKRLVELLMHHSVSVQTPALRTIGNIVTGDDVQTQIVINANALNCLSSLLGSTKKGIRKEACWTISNITAGNPDQIQAIIAANLIPPLVNLLRNAEFDIRKEAAWAISNATSGGSAPQIEYLVRQGVIPPLCDLLSVSDTKVITVALEGLENILRNGKARAAGAVNPYAVEVHRADGIEKLEALQNHPQNEIYSKVVSIIEEFFGTEDEAPAQVTPGMGQPGMFRF